jgi:hypothetical protein
MPYTGIMIKLLDGSTFKVNYIHRNFNKAKNSYMLVFVIPLEENTTDMILTKLTPDNLSTIEVYGDSNKLINTIEGYNDIMGIDENIDNNNQIITVRTEKSSVN